MKCSDIKSSYLKEPIIIQEPKKNINEYGIEIITWIHKTSTRGWIKNRALKKIEFLQSQGINANDSKDIVIRNIAIDHDNRILYKGNQYKIIFSEDIEEKGKYLFLTIERLK